MKKLILIIAILFILVSPSTAFGERIYSGYDVGIGIKYDSTTLRPVITSIQEDSKAEKSGLQEGDIIIKIDGEETFNSIDHYNLTMSVGAHIFWGRKPGESVEIKVLRNFEEYTFNYTLAESYYDHDLNLGNVTRDRSNFKTGFKIVEESPYETIYEIINFDDSYEYYFIYNINREALITSEELQAYNSISLDHGYFAKKVITKKFEMKAQDLSDSYKGEYNDYSGRLFIKKNEKYYYGSMRTRGYFDLRNSLRKNEIANKIQSSLKPGDVTKLKEIKTKYINILDDYKRKVGDQKYKENISKIKQALDHKINKSISQINSHEGYMQKNEGFLKCLF